MGFKDMMKIAREEASKRRVQVEVVSGASLIFGMNLKRLTMIETSEPGTISFGKGLYYYYMGIGRDRSSSRNMGKTAAGTIVGTVLAPGVGTVIGAAVGARKKDTSIAELDFIKTDTRQVVTLIIKCDDKKMKELSVFPVSSYREEVVIENITTEDSIDSADEIRKFKALLDDGIINEEEFNAKKRDLLNL